MPPKCHLAADVGTNRRHLAADVGTDRSIFAWVKIYASEYIIHLLVAKRYIKRVSTQAEYNVH